jgi:DNA-binding response OmpR family regulator
MAWHLQSIELNIAKTTPSVSSQVVPSLQVPPLQIVIVDSSFEHYDDFVTVAQAGLIGLHLCVDGRSAVRFARRFRANVWLVATELDDMTGFDLLEMLSPHILQSAVDPLRSGASVTLDNGATVSHSGVFVVADRYSMPDEQRALASGVAGYLVRPVTLDVIRAAKVAASRAALPRAAV